jgi:outer membrane protein TolC
MPLSRIGQARLLVALSLCSAALAARPLRALGAEPLTLSALLTEAQERNPELRARAAQVRAAAERPAQARAFEDPMIMLELWQVPLSLSSVPLMITLRQPIPWPGKLAARAAALVPEQDQARAEAEAASLRVRLAVTRAYLDYRLAVRSLDVARRSRALLAAITEAVEARYRVGRAELADLLRARQELLSLDNAVLDLERGRDLAMTAINVQLSRPVDRALGEPVTAPVVRALPPARELMDRAALQQPEVRAARAALAQALARARAAGRERAPDLAVWAGYMAMLRGNDHTFTAGVQTSLPTFSLQRSNAASREAMAQVEGARAALQAAEDRTRAQVQEALLRLDTAARHLRLHQKDLLPLSEQAEAAARAGYQGGRVDLGQVLQAARAGHEHRLDYERFQAEYGQRLAELEAALGGPFEEVRP